MQLRILLLLWIVLLTFLPFDAIAGSGCGTNWLGSDTNDPDFWVSRNQNLGASSLGTSTTPSNSNEHSQSLPNPSPVNMGMPAPNPRPQNPSNITTIGNVQVVAAPNKEPAKPELPDLNGKWSTRFDGVGGRSMDLIFIQTDKRLMGSGTLNEGSDKLQLIASGSLEKNDLKLDVKTVVGDFINKIDKRYKLDLKLDNRTLSGSYDEYSGETFVAKGNVTLNRPGF
jgi:LysM repeat protein